MDQMLHPALFLLAHSGPPPDPEAFYRQLEMFSLGQFLGLAVSRFWPTFVIALACSVASLKSRQSSWLAVPFLVWAFQSAAHLPHWFDWLGFAALLPRDSWVGSLALVLLVAVLAGVAICGRLEFGRGEVAAFAAAMCTVATVWIDQALVTFVIVPWPRG